MLKPALLCCITVVQGIPYSDSAEVAKLPESAVNKTGLCKSIGHPILRISIRPIKPDISPVLTIHTTDIDLLFNRVIDIKGKGANCIKGYTVGFILMDGQDVYRMIKGTYLARGEKAKSPYAITVFQKGPMLKGREPTSVAGLSFSQYNHQRVGVWSHSGTSSLALFKSDNRENLPPYIIGTSKDELRDVNYFPAPDALIGEISVLHDVTPNHVEILVGSLRIRPFVR